MEGHPESASVLASWGLQVRQMGQWAQRALRTRRPKRLRVRETLSLGEKRFVAVIEYEGQELLVGGSGSSFALLARLEPGRVATEATLPSVSSIG
jgi:flagellar biogenesis protein FliO